MNARNQYQSSIYIINSWDSKQKTVVLSTHHRILDIQLH
jgi:hypothetical protein